MSAAVPSGPVLVEVDDGVATVTLHRPEARNAISRGLLSALRSAMGDLAGRDDVGAVVLTGTDPAFCAGVDLKELSAGGGLPDTGQPGVKPWYPWPPIGKPVVGAINGPAVTGGLELALHCDFLIASERAAFADTHARVGVMPGWGLSVLLPERVGRAMARRMSLTGDFVDARRALAAGLVTEVVSPADLIPTARRIAATIASNDRAAVSTLYDSYRRIEAELLGQAFEIEQQTSRAWQRAGYMGAVGGKVEGVMARGRDQLARAPGPEDPPSDG